VGRIHGTASIIAHCTQLVVGGALIWNAWGCGDLLSPAIDLSMDIPSSQSPIVIDTWPFFLSMRFCATNSLYECLFRAIANICGVCLFSSSNVSQQLNPIYILENKINQMIK
jgi:hypothetical protein